MDQMSGETKCSCLRSGPDSGSPACLATLLLWGPSWLIKSLYWHAKSPPVSHPRATEQGPNWGTADQGIHQAVPYRLTGGSQTFNLVAAGVHELMPVTLNDHRDTMGLPGMLDGTCAPYLLEMGTLSEKKKMFGNGKRLRIVTGQKKISLTQAWPFRNIFITRGYRLLFPGVARLKLISFQSPQEGKVKPAPLLRRAALGSSENAIHLNKSN